MSSAPSTFAVNCPGCAQRLRFELDAGGPPRVRIRCQSCGREFGVRRPGVAPAGAAGPSTPGMSGGAGAGAGGATAGGATVAAGSVPPTVIGVPAEATVPPPPLAGTGMGAGAAGPGGPSQASVASMAAAAAAAARLPVFGAEETIAGRYRVVTFLAQGGMGEVYEVEDTVLRERVALKTVRPDVRADSLAVERFRREIQLARKVTHPNVCRIFDVSHHRPLGTAGPRQEIIFLTMELLRGETLSERLRRGGPLPAGEALPIARQICLGLEAAHQAGIVHRDLKPGNVVLVPARGGLRAVVTDFGLARLEAGHDPGAPTLTTAGGLVGTPAYLAPEQLEGSEITTAVDIYALGIVLYEMATGTVPFIGDSLLSTAVKRLKEKPASPRVHAPDLDWRWETAILRCLEREPAARFATALDVAAALAGETAAGSGGNGGAAEPGATVVTRARGGWGDGGAGVAGTATGSLGGQAPGSAPAAFAGLGGGSGAPPAAAAYGTGFGDAGPPDFPGSLAWDAGVGAAPAGGAGSRLGGGGGAGGSTASGAGQPTAAAGAGAGAARRRRRTEIALVALIAVIIAVAGYRVFAWRAQRAEEERRLGLVVAEVTPRRSVAVLGFKDLSGAADTAWLSPALAEMLSTELGAGGALRIVTGEDVARVRLELRLGQTDSLARDTLRRVRTLLGSDDVVVGSYLVAGSPGNRQIRLDLRLQDAHSGDTTALTETGTEAGLFKLVAHAGERLRHELRAGGTTPSRPALAANPEAARLYSEGMQKLRLFDAVGARDLLVRAVAADPNSAFAHSGLAAAWAALGFDAKARVEAKTAFELSPSLPPADRLTIEARYREATGDWASAIDLYRRLYRLFPDSLENGLRLASAQISAGLPQDALATASALRALPEPSRDDPRIDLAEATAAGARSDFKRQHAAAERAAERAAALGGSLLVAQARLLDCRALRNLGRADDALAACAAGESLYAAAGDRSGVAEAQTHAANVRFDRGDLPGAQRLYEQALRTYRETGYRAAEAGALNNIAVVLRSQGDLDRARQLYEQVLAIAREIGSRDAEAYALNNLAGVMLRRGDLDGAGELFQQSLAIRHELGDAAGEAYALDNLGVALRRRGDLAAAKQRHDEALAIRRRTGQKIGEVASLNNIGNVLLDQGDLAGARRQFEEALAGSHAIGNQSAAANALFGLGEVLARGGDLEGARRNHQAALGLRRGLGEKGSAAESRLALAELDLAAARLPAGSRPAASSAPAPAPAAIAAEAEAVGDELLRQGAAGPGARALSLAAVAAAAAGDPARSRADIDRATALLQPSAPASASQDLRARLTVACRAALLLPPEQGHQATAALAAVRDEATRHGLRELRFEAELAEAERARAAGQPAAARDLAATLVNEARASGFALIDARATALAAPAADRAGGGKTSPR
jgi:tetratricopeptide (TPR) repeat protein/tRNA A-37 threonylcarbamoyl transferase component Bud32/TolB-like protein